MDTLFDRPVALSIGPQRCGTSWMYDYLKARGDICLPSGVREIFYFDRHFQRGPEFYASHFSPEPAHKLVMELTTTAFDNPDAPSHVQKLLGAGVRLICPLRHPIERTRAVYLDYLKYGLVRGGVEEAFQEHPQILFASRYADHLERWFTQFGRRNVHLLFYESLQNDPDVFAADLCAALDIPFAAPAPLAGAGFWSKFRAGLFEKKEPSHFLSRREETWLKARLQPEIQRLEKLLNMPLTIWKI